VRELPLDRTLIIAPHPDDDSIAAGGLIQRVHSAGGVVRVLLVTDGENNEWPQRWHERKWIITAADRARWGAMRRSEALAALQILGVEPGSATFLAYPDQKTATLLRAGDVRLRDDLMAAIRAFHPTLIVAPSRFDVHSDHRAIGSYAHAAVGRVRDAGEAVPAIVTYVVHGNCPPERVAAYVSLSEPERRRKLQAIEQHQSQMLLSRRRFVSYAASSESFYRDESDVVCPESRWHMLMCAVRHTALAVLGIPRAKPKSGRVVREERHV
jgi:LmbE family N-acetylglucosaminyl deacetylase